MRGKCLVIFPDPKIKPRSLVSSMVGGAQCQYLIIQNLSSVASGVSCKAKGTELYETGLYFVSEALAA